MKKLIGYVTCSLPDKAFTADLIAAMAQAGADGIELGIPFSDPVADGPVIEAAGLEALKRGFTFNDILEVSRAVQGKIPLYWMGYFNSFYRRGVEAVSKEAAALGVSGFIIPDLPFEQGAAARETMEKAGVDLIDFVAPTDSKERIAQITARSRNFIYLVAYAGITGSGQSEDLSEVMTHIRAATSAPVYVGFGVNRETAKEKAAMADGVIVGSAFVKLLTDDTLTNGERMDRICTMVREIKERINA